ncbi:unnamed protein product, partial [Didymodactylos carnosus]
SQKFSYNNYDISNTTNIKPIECSGCYQKIDEKYYLFVAEKCWHLTCLKCHECQMVLDTELTCYSKDGLFFCRKDYYKCYGRYRCHKCHQSLTPNDLILRTCDYLYHVNCFSCCLCQQLLQPGDEYGLRDSFLLCRSHFEQSSSIFGDQLLPPFEDQHLESSSTEFIPTDPNCTIQPFFSTKSNRQQQSRKRKLNDVENDYSIHHSTTGLFPDDRENSVLSDTFLFQQQILNSSSSSSVMTAYQQQQQRQKRMRTSFKHHQLRIMKTFFTSNHNPDAKDLKNLAQKTGLSKRVLQVWFQNARAKYRRSLLQDQDTKQESSSSTTSASSCTTNGISEDTIILNRKESELLDMLTDDHSSDGGHGDLSRDSITDTDYHQLSSYIDDYA